MVRTDENRRDTVSLRYRIVAGDDVFTPFSEEYSMFIPFLVCNASGLRLRFHKETVSLCLAGVNVGKVELF